MARYKPTEKGQGLFLTVNLSKQIIEGACEHTLQHLINEKLNLEIFDSKYNNDKTGATAIEPRILLKIILYCYSMVLDLKLHLKMVVQKNHGMMVIMYESAAPMPYRF